MPGGSTWFMIWQARERCLLGGFDDDPVAGDQRRRDLQRHQQQRHVPWNDGADDADGLALGDGEHARLERHALALELGAEPAVEDQHIGEDAGLDAAFGADRLAGLERDQPRDLLDMLAQQPAAFMDQPAALAPGELPPGLLRLLRRLDRDIDIGRGAFGCHRDLLLRGRVHHRERAAGYRRHQRAVDQQLVRQLARQRARIERGLKPVLQHRILLSSYRRIEAALSARGRGETRREAPGGVRGRGGEVIHIPSPAATPFASRGRGVSADNSNAPDFAPGGCQREPVSIVLNAERMRCPASAAAGDAAPMPKKP
jgi:hypothetical protein